MTEGRAHGGTFVARLFKYPGPGGWHFAPVPDRYAPPVTHAWGRSPGRVERSATSSRQ